MRYRMMVGMLTAGALAAPTTGLLAAVQESERDEVREFRFESGGPEHLMRIVLDRRARLGIKVNLQKRETDSVGAYVESVTPSGPAAKAGIRSGDIITKLDGKSVLSGGSAEERDGRQSPPGLRLIELAARLEPGDSVPVEYRRGKDRRTVTVVTEEEPAMVVQGGMPGRPFRMRIGPGSPDVRLPAGDFIERFDPPLAYREFMGGSPLARLELAPMNEELGEYFGTDEGVLVISSPANGGLGLRGGDVVLAVDGRKPAGPSHLLRILRSYESGESFRVDIQRNRKRETITARLAERGREGDE